jgi:hypothetical protein
MFMKKLTIILLLTSLLCSTPTLLAQQVQSTQTTRTHVPGTHNNSRRRKHIPVTTTGRSYINVDGERVPSPIHSKSVPAGASAKCGDGTYSFSRHRRGTCSHHGGVSQWL